MHLDYYTFGETSKTEDRIKWRCTGGFVDETKKRKRCTAYVVTRIIGGYEMVQMTYAGHNHPPKT